MRKLTAATIALLLFAGACGDDDDDSTATTTESASEATTGDDASETTGAAELNTTSLLPDADQEEQLVYFARGESLAVGGIALDSSHPEAVLTALLDGPDAFETEIGMHSEIPEGTEVIGVAVNEGAAVVDLSSTFEQGGGSLSMQVRVAQIVFTLTALDDIDAVTIVLDGDEVDAIGGEGVPAVDLTRSDFAAVVPPVMVEVPTPDQLVELPLEARGLLAATEATVTVTDPEGLIVAQVPVEPTDGAFSIRLEGLEIGPPGLGAIIADADGVTYEVPVRFE
jgi:germination protein M